MSLTRLEEERISDNRLKIQAVAESLNEIDPGKIPELDEIQSCLEHAERSLSGALRAKSEKA